jgi:hypothetical protein
MKYRRRRSRRRPIRDRRREETAATRSLPNTAKLLEDNPLLVRLKDLEPLERIADKVEKMTVVGGLNTLLDGTITIQSGFACCSWLCSLTSCDAPRELRKGAVRFATLRSNGS